MKVFILLTVCWIYYASTVEGYCDFTEFSCSNGRCIRNIRICDGYNDCGDYSDERNCNNGGYCEFSCSNGRCTRNSDVCNGENGCRDNSDERYCNNGGCAEYRCSNGRQCTSTSSWEWDVSKCNVTSDGNNDCGDNSDEQNCTNGGLQCPAEGVKFMDRDVLAGTTEDSWQSCAATCMAHTECAYWTWHRENSGESTCSLMRSYGYTVFDSFVISGESTCTGDKDIDRRMNYDSDWEWAKQIVLALGPLIPALIYLVVCLKDRIIRQDPSKWPCITYVVVGQTSRIFYFIVVTSIPQLYYARDGRYSGICFLVMSSEISIRLIIGPVLLCFISVERMLALTRDVSSGISRISAIITSTLILIIGYAFTAGINVMELNTMYPDPFFLVFFQDGCWIPEDILGKYVALLPFNFVFVSTIVMSVLLCKASGNKGKAGAIGKLLPYIVANMAYLLYSVNYYVILSLRVYIPGYYHTSVCVKEIVIILSWLFGDPTLRKVYQALCCPCIKMDKNEEKITLLTK